MRASSIVGPAASRGRPPRARCPHRWRRRHGQDVLRREAVRLLRSPPRRRARAPARAACVPGVPGRAVVASTPPSKSNVARPSCTERTVHPISTPASRRAASGRSVRAVSASTAPSASTRPLLQQHQAVGERIHLIERVGHVQDRDARGIAQPREEGQHLGAARGVERGQRFVHQQQARAGEQGASRAPRAAAPRPTSRPGRRASSGAMPSSATTSSKPGPTASRGARRSRSGGWSRRSDAGTAAHPGTPPRSAAFRRQEDAPRRVQQRRAIQRDRAPLGPQQPATAARTVDLPQPEGTEQRGDAVRRRGEGGVDAAKPANPRRPKRCRSETSSISRARARHASAARSSPPAAARRLRA
jgi:hypothetical protein